MASGKGIKVSDIDELLREIEESNNAAGRQSVHTDTASSVPRGTRKPISEQTNNVSAAVQFSTYVAPPEEILSARAEDSPLASARPPQGLRLTPLAGGGAASGGNSPSAGSKQQKYAPITLEQSSIVEAVRKARGGSVESAYDEFVYSQAHQEEGSTDEGNNNVNLLPNGNVANHLPHVVNFLPVMHARVMTNVAGIIPKPRWGHTFTSVGDAIYLFGGTTADGTTNNDVFEFLPKFNSFEPIHMRGENAGSGAAAPSSSSAPPPLRSPSSTEPPSARCHHSAVSYQDRYLVIFGGQSERGTVLLNDVHIFDTKSHTWRHVENTSVMSPISASGPSVNAASKNEPSGRFGHSAVVIGSKMYVFGGKCIKKGNEGEATSSPALGTTLSNDVFVFCLSTLAWKKRIHFSTASSAAAAAVVAPAKRFHHGACAIGETMYISGGEASAGQLLSDTWALDTSSRLWRLVHSPSVTGSSCPPRSRHALFGCGEALLAVAGVVPDAPSHQQVPLAVLAVMESCPNTGTVRPLALSETNGWIPVSLGSANANTIPPTKRSFGATSHKGFFYTVGGVVNGAQPTAEVTRCLAMDGVPNATDSFAALQAQMRNLRQDKVFTDMFLEGIADGCGSEAQGHSDALDTDTIYRRQFLGEDANAPPRVGCHRLILQNRAPKFYADVQTCRSVNVHVTAWGAVMSPTVAPSSSVPSTDAKRRASSSSPAPSDFQAPSVGSGAASVPSYAISAASRGYKGLSAAFTPRSLKAFLDYIYSADLPNAFADVGSEADFAAFLTAARTYDLISLHDYLVLIQSSTSESATTSKPEGSLSSAPEKGKHLGDEFETKRAQLLSRIHGELPSYLNGLLETGKGATASVVFVDEDTHLETTYVAHPLLLSNSCEYFRQILRPILTDGKIVYQCNGITAKKLLASGGAASKRSIVIAKVPIPRLGTRHVMRYLYTRELSAVPPEDALMTMIAASTLGLYDLQAHCEAIVAREEVTYETACAYITLATAHKAPLLSELSILTAALGFFEPGLAMEQSIPFVNLPKPTQSTVKAIAAQLQGKWATPAVSEVPHTIQQDPAAYQRRMSSAAGAGYGRDSASPAR